MATIGVPCLWSVGPQILWVSLTRCPVTLFPVRDASAEMYYELLLLLA